MVYRNEKKTVKSSDHLKVQKIIKKYILMLKNLFSGQPCNGLYFYWDR